MSDKSPVVLILGAGPKIGIPTAQAFASKGYKVAVAARSLKEADSADEQLNINIDLANPEAVVDAFAKVKKDLGVPSMVIYNGMSRGRHNYKIVFAEHSQLLPRHSRPRTTPLQSLWKVFNAIWPSIIRVFLPLPNRQH